MSRIPPLMAMLLLGLAVYLHAGRGTDIPSLKDLEEKSLSPDEIDDLLASAYEKTEGGVPDGNLVVALVAYTYGYGDRDREEGKNWLRLLTLQLSEELVRQNRILVFRERLDDGFQADFDDVIAWRDTLEKDPDRAFEAAREFAVRSSGDNSGKSSNAFLREELLQLAADLGHEKARRILAGEDRFPEAAGG